MITQSEVRKLFTYSDGKLIRNMSAGKAAKGDSAGAISHGYTQTRINGVMCLNHRIVFLHQRGYMPKFIDHINGIKSDNRIENLRECTLSENQHNRKVNKNSITGIKGVGWSKSAGKWHARIYANKKGVHLGVFDSIKDAELAVIAGRLKLHGEFCNHG